MTLETRTLEFILLFILDQNLKCAKIQNWLQIKLSEFKSNLTWKNPPQYYELTLSGKKFFYQVHAIGRGEGKNQSPTGLNTIHKYITFQTFQTGRYLLVISNGILTSAIVFQHPFHLTTFKFTLINFAKCQESILISLTNSHYLFQAPENFASTLAFFPLQSRGKNQEYLCQKFQHSSNKIDFSCPSQDEKGHPLSIIMPLYKLQALGFITIVTSTLVKSLTYFAWF